ncbi:hypothetical protein [Deinococcus arenicola]|uniref:Uncharacterized protein n=1 Tax=Deinococcus arenicola TaxID=2994950 RepID=A0ABU4DWW6_9DEIO|nr:hypothetical protein [Deinococcus sp. ZS9-10]MDV6376447.1 hypothetical protein [Deinococcus sp. ZS9-10]
MTAPRLTAAAARARYDASPAQAAACKEAQAHVDAILTKMGEAADAGEHPLHYVHEFNPHVMQHVRSILRDLGYTFTESEDGCIMHTVSW